MTKSRTDELFSGMSVQTISLVVTALIEMIMFSFWSRHLTKQEFGYMAAINGILAIVGTISQAGLGSAIVQKKNATKEFISTAFTLSLILGILGMLVVLVFSPQLAHLVANDSYLSTPLRVMSLTLLLNTLLSVSKNQLIKQLRFKRNTVIEISSYAIGSVIGVVLALIGWGLYAMIVASISSILLNIVLIYLTSLSLPRLTIYKEHVSGIVGYGGWLTLGSLVVSFANKADSLLLSRLISVEALGSYNRPSGFVNTISTKINSIFDTVLFPLLSSIQDDKQKIHDVLLRAVSLLNSCSIVLAAAFFFNAELIITVFFGKEWMDLVPIMRIVSLAVVFRIDGRLVDCFFRSLNLVRLGAYLRFLQAGIVIIGIFIGAKYGIIGVAVALTACDILIILIKVLALALSVKVSVYEIVYKWFISWRSILLFLLISVPYLLIPNHSIVINVLYAVSFSIVFVCVFILWPKLVGKEYAEIVTPQIDKIKSKFGFRK